VTRNVLAHGVTKEASLGAPCPLWLSSTQTIPQSAKSLLLSSPTLVKHPLVPVVGVRMLFALLNPPLGNAIMVNSEVSSPLTGVLAPTDAAIVVVSEMGFSFWRVLLNHSNSLLLKLLILISRPLIIQGAPFVCRKQSLCHRRQRLGYTSLFVSCHVTSLSGDKEVTKIGQGADRI